MRFPKSIETVSDRFCKNFIYTPFYSPAQASKAVPMPWLACRLLDFQFRSIKLHINSDCNLRCFNCYSQPTDSILTRQEIFELLNQIKRGLRNRSMRLCLLGGEPLLRKDFFEIIAYARRKAGIRKIQVFTNGTLVTRDIARRMKKSGVTSVVVTLHSHDKEIHDGITRGNGSWSKTVEGIKSALYAEIATYSFTIITAKNITSLNETEVFVRDLGAATIYFPYIRQHENDPLAVADKQAYQDAIARAFNKSKSHRQKILKTLDIRGKLCSAFVSTICVRADGTVTPCSFVNLPLGNVREEKFFTILHNARRNAELISFLSVPSECQDCSIKHLCGGGCKAFRYSLYKDAESKDVNCQGPYHNKVTLGELGSCLPYIY